MQDILVPISVGELLDKITILEIKASHISDAEKLANVQTELTTLNQTWQASEAHAEAQKQPTFAGLFAELKATNQKLWNIEDDIRDEERHKRFGERFIELARSVYVVNDVRARLKREINVLLGSRLVEEKSYASYQ